MSLVSVFCCCCPVAVPPTPPLVTFQSNVKGDAVSLSNFNISGTGVAFANTPLIQTRAYWEITLVEKGDFCIGVSHKSCNKNVQLLGQPNAWCLMVKADSNYMQGDVFGISFDLAEVIPVMKFYLNGKHLKDKDIRGIRGDVFPAVSGLILLLKF